MPLLTHSIVLKALGWWLFNSLWQLGLLWLIYVLYTFLFRNTSAKVRHGLALGLLLAGACWSAGSFICYFVSAGSSETADSWGTTGGISLYSILTGGHRAIEAVLPYCAIAYLVTLLILFAQYANQYVHTRRLRRTGLSKVPPALRLFTSETAQHMGINREVGCWFSTEVEAPITLGMLKPIILLPLATVTNLTTAQLEAVLLHELAHIRQHDYLLNLGIAALEILFFFNPFARLLVQKIKKEREHRCDDTVIQFRYDPHAYASALLSLATHANQPQLVLAATGSHDQLLLQRVRRILNVTQIREKQTSRSLLLFILPLMASLLTLNFSHRTDISGQRSIAYQAPNIHPAQMINNNNEAAQAPSHKILSQTTAETIVSGPFLPIKTAIAPPPPPKVAPVIAKVSPPPVIIVADDQPDDETNNIVLASQPIIQALENAEIKDLSIAPPTVATIKGAPGKLQRAAQRQIRNMSTTMSVYMPNTTYVPDNVYTFNNNSTYRSGSEVYCDTSSPEKQYVYLQQQAIRQMQREIAKMQKNLQIQLKIMQAAQQQENVEVVNQQRLILKDQIRLQQEYLEKRDQLQKEFEKTVNKKVIVVI